MVILYLIPRSNTRHRKAQYRSLFHTPTQNHRPYGWLIVGSVCRGHATKWCWQRFSDCLSSSVCLYYWCIINVYWMFVSKCVAGFSWWRTHVHGVHVDGSDKTGSEAGFSPTMVDGRDHNTARFSQITPDLCVRNRKLSAHYVVICAVWRPTLIEIQVADVNCNLSSSWRHLTSRPRRIQLGLHRSGFVELV